MKLCKRQHTLQAKPSIAPLIDIVLLLIIFCMTVTQLTKNEVEDLTLPQAEQGIDQTEIKQKRMIINVMNDGRIVISGQTCNHEKIATLLDNSKDQFTSGEMTVIIRGDRATRWTEIAGLLQMCASRQIREVNVAVLEPQ